MISVVMASYLGDYDGAASNRPEKLHRAINSFLVQGIGELIIVADGCEQTVEIANSYTNPNIQCYFIPKQSLFSGQVRQYGIEKSKYDWVCYLDSDDTFAPHHLSSIKKQLDSKCDWMYYDDIIMDKYRPTHIRLGHIGTSSIVHKKTIDAVWPDGYNHDWNFVEQLGPNFKKINNTGYVVHHIPYRIDS